MIKILSTLLVLILLVSCSTLKTQEIVQTKASANSIAKCPIIPDFKVETFGDTVESLETMISLYTDCAIRHNGLVDYELKVNK